MLTIEQIKEKLKDRNISAVAKALGVHQNTLYRLDEKTSYKVVKALSDYLESN